MNMIEARKEAKRRWGAFAFATPSRIHKASGGNGMMKGVGKRVNVGTKNESKVFMGWGETWDEAFANADKQAVIDHPGGAR